MAPSTRERAATCHRATTQIDVSCQGVPGTMHVLAQQVFCHCAECKRLPPADRVMSCPQVGAWAGWLGGWLAEPFGDALDSPLRILPCVCQPLLNSTALWSSS